MENVSVCMATYNGEKFLRKQVQSILDQLSPTDELVVSDDSSTDNTLEVLRSFKDDRIKIVKNTRAKGPVGNFATALANAQFDYLFLADQDDAWIDGKVKKHVELMKQYEVVVSDAIVINEDGSVIFDSFFKARNSGKGFFKNLKRNSYIGCCMSFRRSLLDRAFPFPDNLHMHDWWLGLITELSGSVIFCEEKFMYYNRHENTVTQTLQARLPMLNIIQNRWSYIKQLLIYKIKGKF